MVEVGLTFVVPVAATVPTFGSIEIEVVVPVTLQDKVEVVPKVIEFELAVKLAITGDPAAGAIVTVAVAVTEPAAFVAVNVYVVVAEGFIGKFPVVIAVIPPNWDIETAVALLTFHARVVG